VIDFHTTRTLRLVQDLGTVRYQAVIQRNAIGRPSTGMIEVSINLYGRVELKKKVGLLLAHERQFLQHPDVVDPEVNYDNPHYFKTPGPLDLNRRVRPRYEDRISNEAVTSEVCKVLDSLSIVESNFPIPAIDVLRTPLLR
jgi:hypothetical protein